MRHRRGFTIVELIVVIGILALLLGILLPSLAAVRGAARMSVELSAGRQMFVAYQAYANGHNDAVLPGYKSGLYCRTPDNRNVADITIGPCAARYPWRLAPYLDFNFDGLYVNHNGSELERLRNTSEENFIYTVSLGTSLGLNSYWVGGHEGQGLGFSETALRTFGQFYVQRMTQIRRPEELIIFASARANGIPTYNDGAETEGYFLITSPYFASASSSTWSDLYDRREQSSRFGNVSLRHNDEAVVVTGDGHVETKPEFWFRDMRHWANGADAEVWALSD